MLMSLADTYFAGASPVLSGDYKKSLLSIGVVDRLNPSGNKQLAYIYYILRRFSFNLVCTFLQELRRSYINLGQKDRAILETYI